MDNRNRGEKKVVIYVPWLGGGGAEMHAMRLANALATDGVPIILIVSSHGGEYEEFINRNLIEIYSLNIELRSALLRVLFSVAPLAKALDNIRPITVISFMDLANVAIWAATWISKAKPKTVFGVQTSLLQALKFHWTLSGWVIKQMTKVAYKSADVVVALSAGVASEVVKTAKVPYKKVAIIPNIGLDKVVGTPRQLKSGRKIIACGRLIKLKGFELVITAMKDLVPKEAGVTLTVVGDGPERSRLESMRAQYELEKHIQFTGFVTNATEELKKGDLLIVSSYYEGFGNVIIEAMSLGVPVISTDCPYGPGEIITNAHNGLLVSPGSSDALRDAILALFGDKDLYEKISKNGLETANKYLPSCIAQRYKKLTES